MYGGRSDGSTPRTLRDESDSVGPLEAAGIEATTMMCRARAQLLAVLAAIIIGFSDLPAWASGTLNTTPGHRVNGATGGIAGISLLIGLGVASRAWRYHKTSRPPVVSR